MPQRISNIENAYLNRKELSKYTDDLLRCIDTLDPYLTKKQMTCLLKDLQLVGCGFDEAKYIQAACETCVTASLAESYGEHFKYEAKINPPKNVDCVFSNEGATFNVEIKCPDYSKKNTIDENEYFSLGSFGRLSNFDDTFQMLCEIFNSPEAQEEGAKPLVQQHHMDNKLKDYLLSAQGKFNETQNDNELNILLICCSDAMDLQKWFHYMYGVKGLLSNDSFINPLYYNRVDVVVLTNLYHRHHEYWLKSKISEHWCLSESFNLIFSNPYRRAEKYHTIMKLVKSIPNHSKELNEYRSPDGIDEFRIVQYVVEELDSRGLNYFDHASNNRN